MPSKVQLIGGHFQDAEGNVLALGRLRMELVQDEQLSSSTGQVCGGISILINLDSGGSVSTSPAQSVWPTDVMTPLGAFYTVWGYKADGQLAWGPNYNLLVPSGATFDVDNWVPNTTGAGNSGSGGSSNLQLQTNGVNNGSQTLLDLQQGTNVTIVDNGVGQVTISASGGSAGNGPRNKGLHAWATAGAQAIEPTQGAGCTPAASSAVFSAIDPTATDTPYLGVGTGTGAGTLIMWLDSITNTPDTALTLGILGLMEKRIILPSTANIRVWLGMEHGSGNGGSSNFWKSDTPPLPTIGFRYSTAAGDTHWQCVVTDGTTQITNSSGIAPDTNGHIFAIEFSTPNVLFFIDGTQVGSISIGTTTLTAAQAFTGFFTVDNVSLGNNKVVGIDYLYWDTSPA